MLAQGHEAGCGGLLQASVLARLSDLAYGKPGVLPTGYTDISRQPTALQTLRLTPGSLWVAPHHFRARAFSCLQGTALHYVIAFGGTDPKNITDDATDVGQALGFQPAQYDDARRIGVLLSAVPADIPIVLTGHSLGGGLATEAAFYSGRPAVVFNAAGLHRDNMPKGAKPPQVDAYSVDGDPVTFVQTNMRIVLSWAMFAAAPGVAAAATLLRGDSLGGAIPPAYGRQTHLSDPPVAGQGRLDAVLDRHTITRVENDIRHAEFVLQCR
ncbi:hypothetical protein AA103196_0279 [Ameyamaea chiangmaiensis NBRC 103196]|nr:hypothetical protein AA103196_0279 [Ameyamaea chiangmaiensis NBRC 103196]